MAGLVCGRAASQVRGAEVEDVVLFGAFGQSPRDRRGRREVQAVVFGGAVDESGVLRGQGQPEFPPALRSSVISPWWVGFPQLSTCRPAPLPGDRRRNQGPAPHPGIREASERGSRGVESLTAPAIPAH